MSGVIPGSPAYESGLDINDEIIALNGYRVRSASLNSRISDMKEGDEVILTVIREDKLREFKSVLKNVKPAKYKVEKVEDPDELQMNIFESISGIAW